MLAGCVASSPVRDRDAVAKKPVAPAPPAPFPPGGTAGSSSSVLDSAGQASSATRCQPVSLAVPAEQGIAEPSAVVSPPRFYSGDPYDPFNNQTELSVTQLVAEVEVRNPSLQAASAAWRAASARYPQAVSLDDPMFTSMIGPQGVGTDNGGGWMVEASQRIPWRGKRALRGSAASAEADAMRGDIGDVRLRIAEAARTAFYDYYLARRQAEVNDSTCRLLAQFRQIARNKYEVNQTSQQDVLQAEVELAALESRRTELTRDEQVAVARINTLLHRAADHPLPPPPAEAPLPDSLPSSETLQQFAVESRPDLYALHARVRAEEANLALASKEYYPDVNLVAKYDGFMPEPMRPQVGFEFNLPLQRDRRAASVREASDRLSQRRAEYQDRLDQVRYEVEASRARAFQSQSVVALYRQKILPAAERNLESAQANYTSGKLDFLRLLDAQRQLYSQREMYHQAIADYHRRLAELERAIGGSISEAVEDGEGLPP
jgi:outer membrane protein, heavy metal efflux system